MSHAGGPVVVGLDEQADIEIDVERWRGLAARSLTEEGVAGGELNLIFVTEAEMHELNHTHLGEDRPTDVLSFPLDGADQAVAGESLIGDIVVCPVYAARQAGDHAGDRGHRGDVDDELALLVVHGVLHVLGWDHVDAEQTAAMREREDQLLDRLHR